MNLIVLVPPPVEPVTLEEIYQHLRLDPEGSPPTHPDDAMLESQIAAGRDKVEQMTRLALVQQRLRMVLDRFPGFCVSNGDPDFDFDRSAAIELLRPPFVELHSVKYYDAANTLQTLASDQYFVADGSYLPQLTPVTSWPDTYRRADAVQIEYTVGYSPEGSPPTDYAANIPDLLKQAIKFEVQLQYDELSPEKRQNIQDTIARLVRSYVIPKF